MKSKYISLAIAGAVISSTLSGCYDMDTVPMTTNLTEEQKIEAKEANPELAQASIVGICALFSTYGNLWTPVKHNDFGIPALMLGLDSRTADMASDNTGYNWFSTYAEFSDCNENSYGCNMAWRYNYNQILAANTAVGSLNPESEDPLTQFYLGQAYAMRANAYFMLAQLFQHTYVGHENEPCVMLITDKNQDEVLANGIARASVKEVYEMINTDLTDAIKLIGNSGLDPEDVVSDKPKRFVSLAAAYGLRARVNLVKELWAEAAEDAADAISNFNGAPLSKEQASQPGFISIDDKNWMWGIAINENDLVVQSGLVNQPSHLGSFSYGYSSVGAWRRINAKLFISIPESDVRRGWFLDEESTSANLTPAQQDYCDKKGMPAFTQVKFAPYAGVLGTSNNACDIALMRVEEMYLILAEATAKAGGDGASILNSFVQKYRDPSFSVSGDADAVQEACFQQRRVELFGEGRIYFDYLRLHKGCDRVGGGFPTEWTYDIPADDQIFIYPIPNAEINGNKLFNSAANNPPCPQPNPVAAGE